jgi:voltage-gated potassium channel
MAQLITSPTVADFMKMATGVNPLNFYMDEQRLGKGSELCGRLLKETPIRARLGVIVVAVRQADGELVTNPSPDIQLNENDVLVSLGPQEKLAELKRLAAGAG